MAGWFRGTVKAVPSGDSLVIMGNVKEGIPPEKSITLSSLMAPRLARRDTIDEPFAWASREFLRKKCIGKEVTFKVDYVVANLNNREFGSVFMADTNLALAVVTSGWAKVRQGAEKSPYFEDLLKAEEQARQQGLGIWNKEPGASEASIRSIPPSAIGDNTAFDAREFLKSRKGELLPAIVEQVRDGSSFRVYLLPSFQFVQVHLAGVQAPSMGRRVAAIPPVSTEDGEHTKEAEATNGTGTPAPTVSPGAELWAQKAEASGAPEPWAREAKHFTEVRILHKDVRIMLEGTDKFNTLFGSVSYIEGDKPVDLALELLKQGLAKYAEWSANMLEEEEKKQLKAADLQSKKAKLRVNTNFQIPESNSKAIKNDSFTGKVIEVVSSDCLVVTDDAVPPGTTGAERRVFLSSIQGPKRGGPITTDDPRFRDAKEFVRCRVIGQQVHVYMEYSRQVDAEARQQDGSSQKVQRVLDFGSVFLSSAPKGEVFEPPLAGQPPGYNVAEMIVANGHAQVVKHRDFDDRSHFYDNLLAAEKKAQSAKKGLHSPIRGTAVHVNDLTYVLPPPGKGRDKIQTEAANKARQFLPFLQRARKLSAVVDFVFSGHRYKLVVPKETCVLFFTLSGVRCPPRDEPYADEALSFMRRRILQRNVEIEVETVDKTGTFLGSLYEGKVNVGIALLEAGLAKLQDGFGDRITDGHLLVQAEEHAKKQRLKVWENESESPAESNATDKSSKQELLEVQVTEVIGGGRFYIQAGNGTRTISSIQQKLESLKLEKVPPVNFAPDKGQVVLAHFSMDNSWYRAKVVSLPKESKDGYEVFYIDYGNQETVPLSKLRPMDPSIPSVPEQAHLCSLAYIKVPELEADFGEDAAEFFMQTVSNKKLMARVEERDSSAGKAKGQGTGPRLGVTLIDVESSKSVNAALLEAGYARLEKAGRWDSKEKKAAVESLAEYQESARKLRKNIWEYGDVESDDEDGPRGGPRGGRGGRK